MSKKKKRILIIVGVISIIISGCLGLYLYLKQQPLEYFMLQQREVFGVKVYATEKVPKDTVEHITTVLYEYLDNNEDGVEKGNEILPLKTK